MLVAGDSCLELLASCIATASNGSINSRIRAGSLLEACPERSTTTSGLSKKHLLIALLCRCTCTVFYKLAQGCKILLSPVLPPPEMGQGRQLLLPVQWCQRGRCCNLKKIRNPKMALTYSNGTLSSQLSLQASLKLAWGCWHVRVDCFDRVTYAEESRDKDSNLRQSLSRSNPCVFICCEHAQGVVVLVQRLSEVLPLLLVPPIAVRVTELPLYRGRLDITTILYRKTPSSASIDPRARPYFVSLVPSS